MIIRKWPRSMSTRLSSWLKCFNLWIQINMRSFTAIIYLLYTTALFNSWFWLVRIRLLNFYNSNSDNSMSIVICCCFYSNNSYIGICILDALWIKKMYSIVSMVEFHVRKWLVIIFGRSLQCRCIITVRDKGFQHRKVFSTEGFAVSSLFSIFVFTNFDMVPINLK